MPVCIKLLPLPVTLMNRIGQYTIEVVLQVLSSPETARQRDGRNREMTVVPEPVSKKGINWG